MLREIFDRQRASGFPGIAGATVAGRIPLCEKLINEAALAAMADLPRRPAFTLERIGIRDNNVVAVKGTVKVALFTKALNLELALDPMVDFPRDPVLRLRPAQSLGLLGILIDVLSTAVPLPEFVTFSGQTLAIDLKRALESRGFGDLAPLVQYAGFTTVPGVLYIDFRLTVPQTPAEPRLPAAAAAATAEEAR